MAVCASTAEVGVGQAVLLHAARQTHGEWRLVKRRSLADDACWMATPPPPSEAEVADNLTWRAEPPGQARFTIGLRDDHAREVMFTAPGTYTLTPTSAVWCGPAAAGSPITIAVRGR